jgi:predicted MFS family arabinose efflux permease
MDKVAGLEGWRWLFILLGIITFIISVASAFILPDEVRSARFDLPLR